MLIDIDKIIVPERARKKFSNIDKLAESIKENGLIHPPTITPDYQLIAGERRLRACKHLGYKQIEVRVMTVADDVHHLKLERDENDNREAFTFSEAVELGRRIEEIEKEKARERMTNPSQNFGQGTKGRTEDKVANQVGFGSGEQFRKAKFVADNADPDLIKQLDEKQISVHAAYQKLKSDKDVAERRAKQAEANYAIAINQHSEQQEKLLDQIEELKKSKTADSPETLKKIENLEKKFREATEALTPLRDKAGKADEYKRQLDKAQDELLAVTREQLLNKDRYVIHDTLSSFVQTVGKQVKKLELEVIKHPGDPEICKDIQATIEALRNAIAEMEQWTDVPKKRKGGMVIDGEVSVIT